MKSAIRHGCNEPSKSELASNSPSGLKATSTTPSAPLPRKAPLGGSAAPTCLPVSGFPTRAVPSASALDRSFPFALKATSSAPTGGPEPFGLGLGSTEIALPAGLPVSGSQNPTSSPPALASSLPFGLNTTPTASTPPGRQGPAASRAG